MGANGYRARGTGARNRRRAVHATTPGGHGIRDIAAWLDELGELRDLRVLHVGCRAGELSEALADVARARVTGLDASTMAISVASERARPGTLDFAEGLAEALPFPNRAFRRVILSRVVHRVERPRAFAEARRVLLEGGAILITVPDPEGIAGSWLADLFPSWAASERERFPPLGELGPELEQAGFERLATARRTFELTLTRRRALAYLRSRARRPAVMGLGPDELREGIARAERDLPAELAVTERLTALVGWTR